MRYRSSPKTRALPLGVVALLACLPLSASGTITQSTDSAGVIVLGQTNRSPKARSAGSSLPSTGQDNPLPQPTHDSSGRFDGTIRQASALYQIPEELIRAVIFVESGFNPRAVSSANAKGLMQLVPATAQRMQVEDIFDPRQNIFGGTRYLRILANLFNGDLTLTVAAYNAGEAAVLRYGGIPPYRETEDYVTKVVSLYRRYRAQTP